MSVLEWKMFKFFELKPLQINGKYDIIKDTTSYCSNLVYKIFCKADGAIHIFKGGECITIKMSDNGIRLCSIADQSQIFVTVDQNSFTNEIGLNIYNLSNISKKIAPVIISNATIKCIYKVTTLKTIYAKSNLILAFGLENGNIHLYNSPLSRDISSGFKTISVCLNPIKGIEFLQTENGVVKMFACSDAGVFCYSISNSTNISSIAQTRIVLDNMPASIHCWTLKFSGEPVEQYFVVGRDDALYCYTFDGRGPCYAIDGPKQIVKWFGKHLIVVLQSKKLLQQHGWISSQLVIINIVNKMVVLNQELHNIKCILPTADLNNCLIILEDGTMLTLQECELQHKLQLLYKKKMYDIALKLLEDSTAEPQTLAAAHILYGDHLLQRGDTSEAVQMYIKTVGVVSPFHIINKLITTRHNEYLIQYLCVLVHSDFKSPEYDVLLHNCRRRIELPNKVEQNFQLEETKYDYCYIDNSIVVEGRSKIMTFLQIFHDTQQIIQYFSTISDNEIINFFSEYSFWLLSHYPTEITETIKYLFCVRCHNFDSVEKLTRYFMLLLLVNKECALGIINILDQLVEKSLYLTVNNIWTDLVIQLWKKGDLDMNFAIKFLKTHGSQLCLNNVFIICRSHQFWPGIRMMYDKCNLEMLSMRCLVKCFEISPSDINEFVPNIINGPPHQLWLQSLSNETLYGYKSIKFVNLILGRMIYYNPHYILNVLQCDLTNKNFHLSHLNELFLHDSYFTKFKSQELKNYVVSLEERVLDLKQLQYDFLNIPIEFRSRSCDVCKQSIKQPMVYFLCQHSYHRECIAPKSNGLLTCVSCNTIQIPKSERIFQEQKQNHFSDQSVIRSCALQNVSNKLGRGIFNKMPIIDRNRYAVQPGCQTYLKTKLPRDEIRINTTTNPFEDETGDEYVFNKEYDTNLNPFEEK